jgi:hypothetical protein
MSVSSQTVEPVTLRFVQPNFQAEYTGFTMRPTLFLAASLFVTSIALGQNPTDPPAGQHPILTVLGRGVQIYVCQKSNDTVQWVFQAPEASLYSSDSVKVGTHGAGPTWTYNDGSSVKGEVVQKNASPESGAIPWLLLKSTQVQGNGLLSKVEFIRRSETHGGVASTQGCDVTHLNSVSRIPYTANYTFYTSKP